MLVGRERELEALERDLLAAERGEAGLTLVVGEAGLGKSRLVEALVERARARGAIAVLGRAWEVGGAPACWPWTEALRALRADPTVGAALSSGALSTLLDEAAAPAALDAAQARFRLFDTVLSALREASARAPIVVVLDDLHAADTTTLAMLCFVAPRLSGARVLLVGTEREHERPTPEAAELLARLARSARVLRPARLSRPDVHALARAAGLDDALAEAIADATEGLPLFVVEYVRLAASMRGARPSAPPRGVQQALRSRLDAVSEATRRVLELASVAGRSVSIDALRAVGARDVEEAIAEASAHELCTVEGDTLRLSHVLLGDALYRSMPAVARRAAHLALAARAKSAVDAAHHYFAAEAWDEAVQATVRAALRASARAAHDDAVTMLVRALDRLPGTSACAHGRAVLTTRLAEAQAGCGRFADAESTALDAAELARGVGDATLLAEAALAHGAQIRPGERRASLIGLLEEARARAPLGSTLSARVSARLAGAMQPHADPSLPVRMAIEAVEAARASGERETLLEVLTNAGSALVSFGAPAMRVELDRELLELASLLDRPATRLRALLRLVFSHLELGDRAAAEGFVAAHSELARSVGRIEHAFDALGLRSMLAIADGRFEDARRAQEEMHTLLAGAGPGDSLSRVLALQRLGLARASCDLDALAAMEPSMRALAMTLHPAYAELVSCAIAGRRRDPGRCAELASRMRVDARCMEECEWMAEVVRVTGATEPARGLAEHMRRMAHFRTFAGPFSFVIEAPATRALGLALSVLGELDEAERALTEAERTVRAMRVRPTLALVLEDRAELAERRGDGVRASSLYAEARAIAQELGMSGLLARLPVPPTTAARAPSFVLAAEGDAFRLRTEHADVLLRGTRGLGMLASLLARPDDELDALALDGGTEAVDRGDAGELLDARAISAYRARVVSLRERIEQRESLGDRDGASALREELDAIARELARGTGLGGRARRAGAASERARVNVQRRIRAAIKQIEDVDARVAAHLSRAIRTGASCVYRRTNLS